MTDKIVRTTKVDGQTAKGFPGCEKVKFIFAESDNEEYRGAYTVGIRDGKVVRSNGLTESDCDLSDTQIASAICGKVENTKSNGWWLS